MFLLLSRMYLSHRHGVPANLCLLPPGQRRRRRHRRGARPCTLRTHRDTVVVGTLRGTLIKFATTFHSKELTQTPAKTAATHGHSHGHSDSYGCTVQLCSCTAVQLFSSPMPSKTAVYTPWAEWPHPIRVVLGESSTSRSVWRFAGDVYFFQYTSPFRVIDATVFTIITDSTISHHLGRVPLLRGISHGRTRGSNSRGRWRRARRAAAAAAAADAGRRGT